MLTGGGTPDVRTRIDHLYRHSFEITSTEPDIRDIASNTLAAMRPVVLHIECPLLDPTSDEA